MLFRSMGRSEHVTAAADPASPSHSGRSDATAESATPLIPDDNDVLLPQHLNTEDVNVMKDSENADDYESIGSEADGSGSSDDDRIKRRQIGDEESSGVEMSLMDEAFIDCLGGVTIYRGHGPEQAALDGVVTCIFRVRARRAHVPGDE
ncbi:hypothetical protein PC116_g9147 [Phytophthora cactorum]|nr:hypothetical protein PC111_g4985 [Phytophthora cactorum]KAG4242960.1 hypothetical protein PC116_g9147 [Phytophthora cactorum]